jgi:ATP-dependent Clp protease ATP-binding subunit ClpC
MESAIANHEFEKARFYSGEERKERENLRNLRTSYKLDESPALTVGREDIEKVVSKLTGLSVEEVRSSRPTDSRSQDMAS